MTHGTRTLVPTLTADLSQRNRSMTRPFSLAFAVALLLSATAWSSRADAATEARTETREDHPVLVLENARARVAVWPQAGGAVVEYLDKASGQDLVVGPVVAGKTGPGWKDMTEPSATAASNQVFGALPYDGRITSREDKPAIEVACTQANLRIVRTLWLSDDSPELNVDIVTTNVGDKPRSLWARWHPYMKLGDTLAKNSVILAPEGPQEGSQPAGWRKIFIGQGWEQHFLVKHGFWLAADFVTGQGLWMTFDKTDIAALGTWTDYKFANHPKRNAFVAELYPKPTVLAPGASVRQRLAYLPFTRGDDPATMSLGVLSDESEKAAARAFLARVKPNLHVIGPYTMQPRPNQMWTVDQQGRFGFSHRRRDRAAMTDWGFVDAMMQIPAVQETPVRLRYVAGFFYEARKYLTLRYEVTVKDAAGTTLRSRKHDAGINPFETSLYDMRDELSLEGLPDGRYTFAVEVFEGASKTPMHRYAEQRQLIGQSRKAASDARVARGEAPVIERERPLVRELRTMPLPPIAEMKAIPVAVEEAGGVARKQWPVTLGVPLAQAALRDPAAVRLLSPQGQPVPVQTRTQGTWMDGSVKWLQLDFAADVPANSHVFYQLELNQNPLPPAANLVSGEGDAMAIDTGAARWQFQHDVWAMVKDGLWWTDADGTRYNFAVAGPESGIRVEENGPQRAVVQVTGWYTHPQRSRAMAMGELRFEFVRHQPWFRLHHTVTYTGDPWVDKLANYGIALQTGRSGGGEVVLEMDGKPLAVSGACELQQLDHTQAQVVAGGKVINRGRRTQGAVRLAGSRPFTAHLNEAWQLFPKQIDADPKDGVIRFHYWPTFAGAMEFVPREDGWLPSSSSMQALAVGMSRTMTLTIDPSGGLDPQSATATLEEPVIGVTPPRYVAATDALRLLTSYDPVKLPEVEAVLADVMDSYRINREVYGWYGHWTWGSLPNMYLNEQSRWADFGRYAHILNEQNIAHGLWLMYFRTGDRAHLQFARAFSRHIMEVATIRWSEVWPEWVGLSRRHHECIWLGSGDYGHSMLDPFLEDYHATGYRPAWDAAVRMGKAAANQLEGDWRYLSNPLNSLARMYQETQDPFYKQHADRLWNERCDPDRNEWWQIDHGTRMAVQYSAINPQCAKAWEQIATQNKTRLNHVDSYAGLYRLTGDAKWARRAADRVDAVIKDLRADRAQAKSPIMKALPEATQHVLANVRELCYAGEAVLLGRTLPPEPPAPAPAKKP
jgi:hypothetical protein